MNPNDDRVEAIFHAALELAGRGEREALLKAECGDDLALEARVRRLLALHEDSSGLPEGAPLSTGIAVEMARLKPEEAGERIGPYKLLQQIGEGGFGVVWMAEQEQPVRRRVALKIIKMGMDTKEVIARFEQERQALAMMEHPNIAKVFDAGATQYGRPFFVMELVRGVKITDYCDQQELATAERLALFIHVCQAVQHAHQKGIIHRDLKPSNILVTINDGEPVPKVIDFGVAKATQGRLTDATLFTQFEQMVGTPLYMSPEQAELTSLDIDTRSDIYSLGVLLYELLTGRTPIDTATMAQAGMDEIRRIIREVDPPRPSARVKTLDGNELTTAAQRRHTDAAKLPGALRGDLDWIVMKCLEKDRKRRYDTATGLAQDLQRHLANEIVTARPPTAAYLLGKLIRRNKLAFAASAAIALSLLVGLGLSSWLFVREKAARLRAESAETEKGRLLAEAKRAAVKEHELRVLTGQEMNYVGVAFLNDGKLEAAEVTLRKAFGLHRKLLSNEDGNTVMAVGNLAIVLARLNRQEEAASLIDELLPAGAEKRIENYGLFCFRAQYRVNCGLFRAAADDMEKAVRLKPEDGLARLRWAVLLIKSGDREAYDRLRDEMFARFGETTDRRLAEVTAKTGLLLPGSAEQQARATRLAETAAAQSPKDKWAALAKGLCAYRQGKFPQAIESERAALILGGDDATLEVAARSLIALAQTAAGQPQEARTTLREAQEFARARLPALSPLTPFEENWHNILVADLFLREAAAALPR